MIRSRRIASVVVAGLMSCAAASIVSAATPDHPREREVWYAYIADGQRYGSEHITVRRLDDGTFRYDVARRVLIDLLGQRQESTDRTTYIVTADLQPVSLAGERTDMSGTVRIRGEARDGRFSLRYERGELIRSGEFDLAMRPMFRVCLDDWLSSRPAGESTVHCQIINEGSLDLDAVTATRSDGTSGAAWRIDMGTEQGTLAFDSAGIRRDADFHLPPYHLQRVTAQEAGDLQHRKLSGSDLLMFPVDKPITAPQELTSLTLRLSWKDVPLDRFNLEDERQRIIEQSEQGGRHEVTLQIQLAAAADAQAGYPVAGERFRATLADGKYIKPGDADIQRQAQMWTKGKTTALDAIRALSTGVFKHMQGGSLIVETLSGPEVLECRQGKCSEYAILFASLARAAGIPTRIVLGMRMVNGSWVGHMWNEAYAGRWITVDSTADEVGSSVALLKLVHSDTVLGTQPVRFAVAESLHVSIEGWAPQRPEVIDGRKTGIEGLVYTNAEAACRISALADTWVLQSVGADGLTPPTVRFKVPDRDEVLIHFVVINVPAAFTPEALMNVRAARFKTMYKDYEVLKDEPHPVHWMPGRILTFRRAGKDESKPMKTTEILWGDGSTCFLLNLIADEEAHDEYAADFFKLLSTFESFKARKPVP